MGGPDRGRHDRRRAKDGKVGPDGTHYKGDYEYNHRAGQDRSDWTKGTYYNERPAEGDGCEEGVHKRGDWSDEPYYHEQFAENDDHNKDVYKWSDNHEFISSIP